MRSAPLPAAQQVREAIDSLTGDLLQVPPAYSAKSIEGVRAYVSAHRGEAVEQAPVPVRVDKWDIHESNREMLHATITCGTGTYVRALARDLGRAAGGAAHLASLRRTRCGQFDVRDAVSLEDLRNAPPPLRRLTVVAGNA